MARQFTKGIDLAAHQLKRLQTMKATVAESIRLMRKLGEQDSKELSSGTLTKSQTRGAFARGRTPQQSTPAGRLRGKKPGVRLLPINVQSGRLRRSMTSRSRGQNSFETLSRTVPYARFILSESGTRKMVARGMKQEAIRRLKARQMAHVQHFVRKTKAI